MTVDCDRVIYRQPPSGRVAHFRGRLYDRPAGRPADGDLAAIADRPDLLNHREADLALVDYDPGRGRWRLIRDFGATPLYYAPRPDGFLWSFTYRGLLDRLEELGERPEADEETLFDYLATHYRYLFRDPGRTFHRGVRQVPAGSWADMDERGASVHSWLDWEVDPEAGRLGPDEATERFLALLRESVRARVRAAGRPAFTVSSGLDSATVAALAAEELGDIDVFSVGYEGPGGEEYDETAGVADLIRGRNWRWTNLMLSRPDLAAETRKLIELTRSPVVTATWLAYYLMARRLAGFREVFGGLGGDESLAGEFLHFFYFFADLKRAGDEDRLQTEVAAWSRLHDHPVFRKNPAVLARFWEKNIDFATGETRVDPDVYRANWRFFEPAWLERHGAASPPMPRPYPDFLSNRLYQEFTYETTPPTLWGQGMAHQALGLTGVSPFLSPRLFRLAWSLPGTVKYDRGLTKALLRRGLKGILPERSRLNPRKTGFNAPIHQWFREPRGLEPTRELLRFGPLAKTGWLRPGAAEEIIREHQSGQANHMMLLWTLLNAALFLT